MKLLPLDKYGWPVEKIKGRSVTNLIRLLLHTRSIAREECWLRKIENTYTGIGSAD